MHRRGPDPSIRAAGRGPSGQGRRRGRLASCSLQAQRLCPPRSPVEEKEFAKQLACAACPAPANATPPHPPLSPTATSLALCPAQPLRVCGQSQWQSGNVTRYGWPYTHSPPVYRTSSSSDSTKNKHRGGPCFAHSFQGPPTPPHRCQECLRNERTTY